MSAPITYTFSQAGKEYQYTTTKLLGRGSGGTVYIAKQVFPFDLKRKVVVIKELVFKPVSMKDGTAFRGDTDETNTSRSMPDVLQTAQEKIANLFALLVELRDENVVNYHHAQLFEPLSNTYSVTGGLIMEYCSGE